MPMSRSLRNQLSKPTGTGSLDLKSVKADGFQNEGDSMSKKRPNKSLLSIPEIGQALPDEYNPQTTFTAEVEYSPTPREDEARPCSLCESRRPIGTSYSRVYCTKRHVRYCKCHYCGHTWSQERR